MIVVLGILAAVAIPKFFDYSEQAAAARTAANLRTFAHAFLAYNRDTGTWPPDNDSSPGSPTSYASAYVDASLWEKSSAFGGRYNWNYIGGVADVCIYSVGSAPSARATRIMTEVDRILDNGNISTGVVRFEPGTWGGSLRYLLN